jgi:hypothetical protein
MAVKGVNYQIKGTNLAGPAMRQFQGQLQGIRNQTVALQPVQRSWNKGLSENRRAVQQLGFQMTDFSVQIAGGQNAMLAFVQQGGQMLQVFGPAGAILAALLTVFGTLAIVIGKSGIAMSELTPILGILKDEFQFLGTVLWNFGQFMIGVANLIVNNLDVLAVAVMVYFGRMAIAAALASNAFRALLFSMVVLGPVQGALAVGTWALQSAMLALRAVMLTVLPIALLMAVSWLIVKFIELIDLAGGFGNAMALLGDLVMSVFSAMYLSAQGAYHLIKAGVQGLVAAFAKVFEWIMMAWEGLINGIITGWNYAMDAIGAEGFKGAQYISTVLVGAGATADQFAADAAASAGQAQQSFTDAATGIAKAWGNLTSIFSQKRNIDVRDWFGGGAGDKTGGGGGGKQTAVDKVKEEADEIKKIFEDVANSIENALMSGFKAVIKGTKSLKDYALDVLDTILDKTIELLMQPIFAGIASKIAGVVLGVGGIGVPSFAGGGYTGNASRSGGLDGKGGYMAMVHPKESIIDHTVGGGSSRAGGVVHVYVHESESFASTVDARAEGVAVKVVRGGLAEYDRKVLPRSTGRINNDPLVR